MFQWCRWDVNVACGAVQSIMNRNREAAQTDKCYVALKSRIEVKEERAPRLKNTIRRHLP